ncbi:hypothetical protein DXG01_012527 [Tephrocybe rancida]|nr:hypothetical protein DXG01_012527 [Tephrocybe rancida]
MVQPLKNIWVAAADGDLARVQNASSHTPYALVTSIISSPSAQHPNAPDEHTYTPMHAAASYGQIDILTYLLSRGGDVNITDGDGDTPLYTAETLETARFLVEHGARIDHRNHEGISPITHLSEDFPALSTYLQSLLPSSPTTTSTTSPEPPSQHAQNAHAEALTTTLLSNVADIMARAEAEGRDPDEELRAAVSRTVAQGVVTGFELASPPTDAPEPNDSPAKRPRTNGDA